MSEQGRLLRAEVLLLVSVAEASEDPFPKVWERRTRSRPFCFCLQTGLVDPADARQWGTRVEEALGETLEQFEAAEAEEGLDSAEFSEPEDVHEPEFRPPEPMGALVRMVPAEPARHEGLCITAVALHEGGFEVHWHTLR